MGIYTEAVQKLYVAYFNRPADAAGLTYWESALEKNGGKTADIAAAFAATKEYKDTFAGQSEYQIINTIYKNLFGRDAEPAGLQYWGQGLINKVFTIDVAVTTIAGAAQGTDSVAFKAKVSAATAFTGALDLTPEIIGYSGDVANAAAKVWLAGITNDATLTAAIAPTALNATVAVIAVPFVAPMSTTLSAGLDTFVGGAGNDTIFATNTSGAVTLVNGLSAFDNIDGGAGVDTIKFVDLATAAATQFTVAMGGATVKSVEVIDITTTGGLNLDATQWAGVTDVVASAAGTAAVAVTAGTANVNVQSATTSTTAITGGKAVNLSLSAATAGAVSVTGAALTNVTVKGGNVITIDNTGAAAASGTGTTLSTVTLDGIIGGAAVKGASVTNVALKNIVAANAIVVTNGTAAHSLNITADATGYDAAATPAAVVVSVADAVATSVNVSATSKSNVAVNAGLATKVAVTGSAALTLDVAGVAAATSIDASAATGAVTLTGIAAGVTSIVTGSGNDVFTVTAATLKDDTATAAVETVNATVSTGAGNDTVTLTTTGTGKVTVDTGAGNDKVIVTSRGTEILNLSLGDGSDSVSAGAGIAINATDVVDAGAGTDTLALSLVGSANIGAFSNFEVFDTKALAKTLDVDILALKNTVTEIVASGDVGAGATLTNLGAGVGFRVTGNSPTTQTLTQKVGGALTVTVDADEATTANTTPDTVTASVAATNATSVKAVFDTAFKASIAGELPAGDNIATLALNTTAATSLEVVSGGALAHNVLAITDMGAKLAAITVTGDRDLTINATTTGKLASIDASASTGGLITSTNALLDGGTIKLGSGVDMITVGSGSIPATAESIIGFEKSAAIAVSVDPADATASAAAKLDADHLMFTAGVAANANAAVTTGTIAKGVLTFTGAGPSDLAAAMLIADAAAETGGEVVVFEYLGNSYVFQQGGAGADLAVKLVGVTGVTSLTADAGGVFLV